MQHSLRSKVIVRQGTVGARPRHARQGDCTVQRDSGKAEFCAASTKQLATSIDELGAHVIECGVGAGPAGRSCHLGHQD